MFRGFIGKVSLKGNVPDVYNAGFLSVMFRVFIAQDSLKKIPCFYCEGFSFESSGVYIEGLSLEHFVCLQGSILIYNVPYVYVEGFSSRIFFEFILKNSHLEYSV